MLTIGQFARLAQISPRMLRHYDQLGLVKPELVDPETGYRSYAVRQLGRLQRLLALRDLGFGLDQIAVLLEQTESVEQLRGMLQLRRAQIEHSLGEEHDRLRRVEAYLKSLEGNTLMTQPDIIVKKTSPLRIAEAVGTAAGLSSEHINPVLQRIIPEVLAHLEREKTNPRMMVVYYDEPLDDGSVVVHGGFDVGEAKPSGNARVHVTDLPVVEVASVVHHGSMEKVGPVYESLLRWIEDSGYRIAAYSRELYLEFNREDWDKNTTELQVPIAR